MGIHRLKLTMYEYVDSVMKTLILSQKTIVAALQTGI